MVVCEAGKVMRLICPECGCEKVIDKTASVLACDKCRLSSSLELWGKKQPPAPAKKTAAKAVRKPAKSITFSYSLSSIIAATLFWLSAICGLLTFVAFAFQLVDLWSDYNRAAAWETAWLFGLQFHTLLMMGFAIGLSRLDQISRERSQ